MFAAPQVGTDPDGAGGVEQLVGGYDRDELHRPASTRKAQRVDDPNPAMTEHERREHGEAQR